MSTGDHDSCVHKPVSVILLCILLHGTDPVARIAINVCSPLGLSVVVAEYLRKNKSHWRKHVQSKISVELYMLDGNTYVRWTVSSDTYTRIVAEFSGSHCEPAGAQTTHNGELLSPNLISEDPQNFSHWGGQSNLATKLV